MEGNQNFISTLILILGVSLSVGLLCGCSSGSESSLSSTVSNSETDLVDENGDENYYFYVNSIEEFFDVDRISSYLISAHRGSRYYSGWPENCLESFEYILSRMPAIIEMDIRMSKDSVLFLLHDESLDRTTDGSGKADQFTMDQISALNLKDANETLTDFSPSLLRDVLEWGRDKTILKLDIKRNVPFQMVIDLVRETQSENHVIILVYSVEAARIINRLAPELMISLSIRNMEEIERFLDSGLPNNRILAFTGTRLTDEEVFHQLRQLGIPSIQGTIGNLDKQAQSKGFDRIKNIYSQGANIIATDYPLELYDYLFSQSLIKN